MNTILPLLLTAAIGAICYHYAKQRGRNPYTWLAIGLFFGILGLITLFILPPLKQSRNSRRGSTPDSQQAPNRIKINLATLDPSHLDKLWYYLDHNHEQFGPMSIDALSNAWRDGKIHKATFVWNEVMEGWKHFEEVLTISKSPLQTS